MAAAALLAVPVAVAAVIGFSEGLGGVVRGFDTLDGPEPAATGAGAASGGGLDTVLVALVGDGPGPGDDGGDGPDGGSDPGAPTAPGGPGGGASPAPAPTVPGAPPVTVPVDDPTGSVGSLVDDVNRAVDGLAGNP